jgi:hypothetical protein
VVIEYPGKDEWVNSRVCVSLWNIDVQKVISKFEKARSSYWEGRYYKPPDTTYCFLREDGCECAVRFIKANKYRWDIVGYWIDVGLKEDLGVGVPHHSGIVNDEGNIRPVNVINEFKIWLEAQCPKT